MNSSLFTVRRGTIFQAADLEHFASFLFDTPENVEFSYRIARSIFVGFACLIASLSNKKLSLQTIYKDVTMCPDLKLHFTLAKIARARIHDETSHVLTALMNSSAGSLCLGQNTLIFHLRKRLMTLALEPA